MSRSDELELLTALHEGVRQEPRWRVFLPRLQRRLRADHVSLTLAPAGEAPRWIAGKDPGAPSPDLAAALAALRPDRVYWASELAPPDERRRQALHDHLLSIGIRFGRFMRVTDGEGRSAWLAATRERHDFGAADGALLSSLAPHLSIALGTLGALEAARFRAETGEDALARAGIGWRALGRDGRVTESGGAPAGGEHHAIELPSPGSPMRVVLTRAARPLGPAAADALARAFGLSGSEARLAVRLAGGSTLAEAAAALGLTIETARNYSKRIFAKTGTRGQPDLVRLVLTSAAALA